MCAHVRLHVRVRASLCVRLCVMMDTDPHVMHSADSGGRHMGPRNTRARVQTLREKQRQNTGCAAYLLLEVPAAESLERREEDRVALGPRDRRHDRPEALRHHLIHASTHVRRHVSLKRVLSTLHVSVGRRQCARAPMALPLRSRRLSMRDRSARVMSLDTLNLRQDTAGAARQRTCQHYTRSDPH